MQSEKNPLEGDSPPHERVSRTDLYSHTRVALSSTHGFGYSHMNMYIQSHTATSPEFVSYDAYFNGTLLKLLIFNHIDHVSHYFRKIWSLHADDMNFILKWNYYLSFETGFSRFAMAKVVLILIACNA